MKGNTPTSAGASEAPPEALVDSRPVPTPLPLYVTELGAPGRVDDAGVFVMLHGYGASSFTWRHWAPALAKRGRVLLVDVKGFGQAPKPDDGEYAPVQLASVVSELIRQLDLYRVTLVGHSLGGGIALLTGLSLIDEPEARLARTILVASAAYKQRLPPFVHLARRPRLSTALFRLFGARRTMRYVLRSIVYDPDSVTEEMITTYARALESREGIRAALDVGRMIVPDDLDELARGYARLDVPTLLLWGDHDRVVPVAIGERLAAELPSARLVILDQCGHVPPEERPEASLEVVESFLDDTGALAT